MDETEFFHHWLIKRGKGAQFVAIDTLTNCYEYGYHGWTIQDVKQNLERKLKQEMDNLVHGMLEG